MNLSPQQLVVSVEHASPRVPKPLGTLGLSSAYLETHHGWDPGAAIVGGVVARAFSSPLHLGRWTRLLADLNRSAHHPAVVPRATGRPRRPIPANAALTRAETQVRLERYWHPYREAVEADLDAVAEQHGCVLHLSVHSFTSEFHGETRTNDFGLLYQPSHSAERAMADRWDERLRERGFSVRRNYPYRGIDDGFCMRMRAERPRRRYLGMEIEMNQRDVATAAGARRFGLAMVEVLRQEFGG